MRTLVPAVLALAICAPLVAESAEDQKAKEALEAFKKAYASKDEVERAAAVPLLGDPAHPLMIKTLGTLLTSDVDKVRITAAETLAKFTGRKDVGPVLAAGLWMNKDKEDVQKAILTALGKAGDATSVPDLERYMKSEIPRRNPDDMDNEKAAVQALEDLHCKASVEALLDILQRNAVSGGMRGPADGQRKSRGQVADLCRKALSDLLGAKCDNWREWKDWWKDHSSVLDDHLDPKMH